MKELLKTLRPGANIFLLLLIGLLIVLSRSLRKPTSSQMEYDLLIQKILTDHGFSPRTALYFAGVARHETGNYTSPLFKGHSNFFGMKAANKKKDPNAKGRPHAQDYIVPGPMQYAGFNAPARSVADIVLYLDYSRSPRNFYSVVDLVTWMKSKGYFEADLQEYINGVERAVHKILNNDNT